jgi:hypothetical protein
MTLLMTVTEQDFSGGVAEKGIINKLTWFGIIVFGLFLVPGILRVPRSSFHRGKKMSYILHDVINGKVHLEVFIVFIWN